ncbi:MAG: YdhR family protein [Burkholderiaceae bacterium]
MRYAQIFRYVLELDETEYEERWMRPYAHAIAQVPGLIRKTWMADFDTGTFASVYIWEDKASMDAFMASPAITQVGSEPFLKALEITTMPVHEPASQITRG